MRAGSRRCGFNALSSSDPDITMGRYSGNTCRLSFMLGITGIFFVAEIVAGYLGNSLALVSDSFNMLSDIVSLCVGLAAGRLARRPASPRCTFGLARAEAVGALANAAFLAALCCSVAAEALKRLARPEAVDEPVIVLIVGSLGLAVNITGLIVFQDRRWLCARRRRRGGRSSDSRVGNGEAGTPFTAAVPVPHSSAGGTRSPNLTCSEMKLSQCGGQGWGSITSRFCSQGGENNQHDLFLN